jgi:uncharacterized protein YqgC (DUF456 family)
MTIEWWYVLSGVMILVGIAGSVLPALPGAPLVFAGMLLTAWVGDFQHISVWTCIFLGILTAVAMLADFVASALGTKVAGASAWAFVGAAIGAVVGLLFGLIGLVVGPFVGAIAGELIATQNLQKSTRAGLGAAVGFVMGSIAKIGLIFTMLGVFAFALFVG